MLAPVDNPLELAWSPEPESPPVGVALPLVVLVFVGVAVDESEVVVAETNRLESDSCRWTSIGCAHMVIGPVTWVLSALTWRTVTMVELVFGNMLVHPAKVPPLVRMVRYSKSLSSR